jgi:protein-L-isoaspartate O-methyltransferase
MKLRWALRRIPKTVQNVVRDLRLGGKPLGGTVKSRYAHLGAHDVGNADYDDLAILFREAAVRPDDVIVDVGAGKGRAISWLVRAHPGNHVVGIELDPKICADTAARLRKHAQVEVICGDAIELLPADGTLFYLFNPFDAAVMQRFRDRLAELRTGRGRTRVVYYNHKALELFEDDERFAVRRLDDPRLTLDSAIVDLL